MRRSGVSEVGTKVEEKIKISDCETIVKLGRQGQVKSEGERQAVTEHLRRDARIGTMVK
jgi:hypothetical protein